MIEAQEDGPTVRTCHRTGGQGKLLQEEGHLLQVEGVVHLDGGVAGRRSREAILKPFQALRGSVPPRFSCEVPKQAGDVGLPQERWYLPNEEARSAERLQDEPHRLEG